MSENESSLQTEFVNILAWKVQIKKTPELHQMLKGRQQIHQIHTISRTSSPEIQNRAHYQYLLTDQFQPIITWWVFCPSKTVQPLNIVLSMMPKVKTQDTFSRWKRKKTTSCMFANITNLKFNMKRLLDNTCSKRQSEEDDLTGIVEVRKLRKEKQKKKSSNHDEFLTLIPVTMLAATCSGVKRPPELLIRWVSSGWNSKKWETKYKLTVKYRHVA